MFYYVIGYFDNVLGYVQSYVCQDKVFSENLCEYIFCVGIIYFFDFKFFGMFEYYYCIDVDEIE